MGESVVNTANRRIDRIVLTSPRAPLTSTAAHLLQSLGHDVVTFADAQLAETYLRRQRVELAIVELPDVVDEVWRKLVRAVQKRNVALLAVTRAKAPEDLKRLFEEEQLTNFIVASDEGAVDPVELTVTVDKILSGELFGLSRYLAGSATERTLTVRSSTEKDGAVDAAEAAAIEAGCSRVVARNVASAVDELVTNALYNAPVGDDGQRLFAHLDRSEPVTLADGREVVVRFGWDGRRFGLSAEDAYGSLDRERVLTYLRRCLRGGADQVEQKAGGAGVGLYMIFSLTNHFVINIDPGRRTEALALVDVNSSFRQTVARGRSFNVFVKGRV